MQLTSGELDEYVANLGRLAERYGITLDLPDGAAVTIDIERDLVRRFEMVGFLPDGELPPKAIVEISETWPAVGNAFERSAYRYELIDRERGFRRAFHWHDERDFQRRFGVVVHEHCESPIGHAPCAHYFGAPARDGYRAVELLVAAWVADPPDCTVLPCLEPI